MDFSRILTQKIRHFHNSGKFEKLIFLRILQGSYDAKNYVFVGGFQWPKKVNFKRIKSQKCGIIKEPWVAFNGLQKANPLRIQGYLRFLKLWEVENSGFVANSRSK